MDTIQIKSEKSRLTISGSSLVLILCNSIRVLANLQVKIQSVRLVLALLVTTILRRIDSCKRDSLPSPLEIGSLLLSRLDLFFDPQWLDGIGLLDFFPLLMCELGLHGCLDHSHLFD